MGVLLVPYQQNQDHGMAGDEQERCVGWQAGEEEASGFGGGWQGGQHRMQEERTLSLQGVCEVHSIWGHHQGIVFS